MTRYLAGLPGEEIELRTFGDGQHYGPFMLRHTPCSPTFLQPGLVAVTLADQVGRAGRRGAGLEDPVGNRAGLCTASTG